jgi:hypothetical protein
MIKSYNLLTCKTCTKNTRLQSGEYVINSLCKYILMLVVFLPFYSIGQTTLPNLIPPSPESSALFKMLDFPIGGSTGVPGISIPILEVKSGSLSVPISISYDASGRKVMDQTGPLAMGWVINAGGRISRTIHGKSDDTHNFRPNLRNAADIDQRVRSDFEYLGGGTNDSNYDSNYDSQYDIFSYNYGSSSGKFILDENKKPVLIPSKSILVSGSNFPDRIVDEKGVEYMFTSQEILNNQTGDSPITSKLLTSIISANKKDTVLFLYKGFNITDSPQDGSLTITDNYDITSPLGEWTDTKTSTIYTERSNAKVYTVERLIEVSFKQGKIMFNLNQTTGQLQNIEVYDKSLQLIKSVSFATSILDVPANTGSIEKLKLDSILFKDRNNIVVDRYKFEYQPSFNFNATQQDYWGYLNSGTSNFRYVPTYNNISLSTQDAGGPFTYNFSGANNKNPSFIVAGTIKKITYPTGGITEFFFEQNQVKVNSGTHYSASGLRIKKIRTSDGNGNFTYKTYTYGEDEDGYGFSNSATLGEFPNYMQYTSSEKRYVQWYGPEYRGNTVAGKRIRTYTGNFLPDIAEYLNMPVFYSKITVYEGDINSNNGKTVFRYSSFVPHSEALLPIPTFKQPTFSFSTSDPYLQKRYIREYNYWCTSQLVGTELYEKNGLTYKLRRGTYFDYEPVTTGSYKGLFIDKYIDCDPTDAYLFAASPFNLPIYQYADYYISTGRLELRSSSEVTDGVSTVSNYSYNSRLLKSDISTARSSGDVFSTKIKYPFDFNDDVYRSMVARNMIDFDVINESNKKGTVISSTKIDYKDWGNDIIAPEVVSTKAAGSIFEPRIRYLAYDNAGNPVSVKKENGPAISYIYGYNNTVPIAEVSNGGLNQIAFANFEASNARNWGYLSSGLTNIVSSISGKTAYKGTLNSPVLPSGSYKIEMWAKGSGNITVNNVNKVISEVWKFYSWQVDNATAISINTNNNLIDDVRLYPSVAQMKNFTYWPLYGVTDITDPKGYKTSYIYDSYQRLTDILDANKNIVKHYSYNVSNPRFSSKEAQISFKRNNCTPEFYGSTVVYILPEGAFYSSISQEDADNKAQNELNKNGQIYSNQNGECLQYSNSRQTRWIAKNDCSSGIGSEIEYVVEEGKYKSAVSINDANLKAQDEINRLGQAYANTNGICQTQAYKNALLSDYFTKYCGFGYQASPSQVLYTVPAGKYTSLKSQADADQQARDDFQYNGPLNAEHNSTCVASLNTSFSFLNSTSYNFTVTFSNSQGSVTYSVPQRTSSFSVPSDVTYITIQQTTCSSCNFKFTYGTDVKVGYYVTFTVDGNRFIQINNN